MLKTLHKQTSNLLNINPDTLRNNLQTMFGGQCIKPLNRIEIMENQKTVYEAYVEERDLKNATVIIERRPGLKPFIKVIVPEGEGNVARNIVNKLMYNDTEMTYYSGNIFGIYDMLLGVNLENVEESTFYNPPTR